MNHMNRAQVQGSRFLYHVTNKETLNLEPGHDSYDSCIKSSEVIQ